MNRRVLLARAGLVAVPFLLGAKPRITVPKLAPRPEDVGSVDGIVAAYYDVICGPPGKPREWGRDRTLYVPGVKFASLERKGDEVRVRLMTHQEYVERTDPSFTTKGFFEREIHRETVGWGQLLQVMSTYESRHEEKGPVIARGINALQLYDDGKRWWIANAIWQDETDGVPIAKRFLPN